MNASSDTTTKEMKADARDVAAAIEQLQADMKKLSRTVVDRGREGLVKAKHQTADQLDSWGDDVGHFASDLQAQGQHQLDAAKEQVRDRPLLSMLAAFGVGLLVSRLIDRR